MRGIKKNYILVIRSNYNLNGYELQKRKFAKWGGNMDLYCFYLRKEIYTCTLGGIYYCQPEKSPTSWFKKNRPFFVDFLAFIWAYIKQGNKIRIVSLFFSRFPFSFPFPSFLLPFAPFLPFLRGKYDIYLVYLHYNHWKIRQTFLGNLEVSWQEIWGYCEYSEPWKSANPATGKYF